MMPVAALTAALVGVPQAWGRLTLMTVLVALIIAILMPGSDLSQPASPTSAS